MDHTEAKAAIKGELEGYLQARGIDTGRLFRCLNPAHPDKNPSMGYDARRQRVHCFACGVDYDMLDVIGLEYGLSEGRDIFRKAYEVFGLDASAAGARKRAPRAQSAKAAQMDPGALEAYLQKAAARLPRSPKAVEYLAARGIGVASAKAYRIGYDPAWRSPTALTRGKQPPASPRLLFPTGAGYTARAIDPGVEGRYQKMKEGPAGLLGAEHLAREGPVFLVEGEMDMLSVAEAGGRAVSMGSASSVRAFLQRMEEERPRATLLLCLDRDEAGREATEKLGGGLAQLGVPYLDGSYLLGGHKDPNEALMEGREAFFAAVARAEGMILEAREAEREAYGRTCAGSHLQGFIDGIARSIDTPAIATGFEKLDALLDGGLYEGLYIVGAISSLGKTTLVLQMADQIAAGGQDVLVFSLEMARSELMAKSISRETLLCALAQGISPSGAKTARGITTGKRYLSYSKEENRLITCAIEAYRKVAGHIYIHEGIGEIGAAQVRQAVARHVDLTGRTPVVVVDYLQILAPQSERFTDKQNTDRAVLELKRISRDWKLPMIGISSFNRASYSMQVTMEAFKESGAIEYSSDVLIGLQLAGAGGAEFDATEEKRKNPRQVELVVLKNRNGPAGERVGFDYYPLFNYFQEK